MGTNKPQATSKVGDSDGVRVKVLAMLQVNANDQSVPGHVRFDKVRAQLHQVEQRRFRRAVPMVGEVCFPNVLQHFCQFGFHTHLHFATGEPQFTCQK